MRTKNILIKLILSSLIVLMIFNFICSTDLKINFSFADSDPVESSEERVNEQLDANTSGTNGIIMNFIKSVLAAPGRAMRNLNYKLASAGGTTTGVDANEITPFDIFFNRFTLLDGNLFSMTDRDGQPLDTDSIVYKIRTNTSIWYHFIERISGGVIILALVFSIGAIFFRGSNKDIDLAGKISKAKEAGVNYLVSFLLLMLMHYIVIFILDVNDLVINGIQIVASSVNVSDFIDTLENSIFSSNWTLSIASVVIYIILEWQTFRYIIVYIFRLFTIFLLVIISPVIPLLYAKEKNVSKVGITLNSWLRELLFTVFVQSLHALIYAALVGTAMTAMAEVRVSSTADLGIALVAVASLLFVKQAERIVKTIFGFNNSHVISNNVLSNVSSFVDNGARVVGGGAVRAATGRPFISFGKNVDGSDIGIGQVTNGIGNSLRNTATGIRENAVNAGNAFIGGVRNVRDRVTNFLDGGEVIDADYTVIDDNNDRNSENSNRNNNLNQNNSTSERNENDIDNSNERNENGNGNDNSNENIVIAVADDPEGKIAGAVRQSNENLNSDKETLGGWAKKVEKKLDTLDSQIDKNVADDILDNFQKLGNDSEARRNYINSLEEGSIERQYAETLEDLKAYMDLDDERISNENTVIEERSEEKNINKEETSEETNVNNTETHEETNIENHVTEKAEEVAESKPQDESEKATQKPPIIVEGDSISEGEVKNMIKAALNEDKETLTGWAKEVEKKWDALDSQIDRNVANDITNNFQRLGDDSEARKEYINSFKEGSIERQYAESMEELKAYMDLDDESINSKEEMLKAVKNLLESKGYEVPPEVLKMKYASEVDNLELKIKKQPEVQIEEDNPKIIRNLDQLRSKRNRELMDRVNADLKLGVFDNTTNDIEVRTKLEAIRKDVSQKFNMSEPDNIKSMLEGMTRGDRDAYRNYLDGKIPASEMSEKARDAVVLATVNNYIRELERKVTTHGTTESTEVKFESTNQVLKSLQNRKREINIGEITTTKKGSKVG